MPRTSNRLKGTHVRTKKPGRYADGGNLYLQVTASKTKGTEPFRSWIFHYKLKGATKYRMMGLGRASDVSLADAREKAKQQRDLLARGIDPIEARQAVRDAERATAKTELVTFKDMAEQYVAAHRKDGQWEQSLKKYAFPIIGNLDVAEIDVNHVLNVLTPLWKLDRSEGGRLETASRLRGRIENILGYAKVRGKRTGDNPAAWAENLEVLLPSPKELKKVKHHPALPYSDAPQFLKNLRERDGISPRALEFAILTAARTNEVIGATWDEIDTEEKLWTIPAERMKAKREHSVPLSDRAVSLLKRLPREDGNAHVFIGGEAGEPLSNMAMLELVKEMRPGITVHGFRSTFRDWAAEETPHANIVVEMALAHVVGDKTEAAYRRGDLLKKRRRLMADWARYTERIAADKDGNVLPLRKRSVS